jgi:hypothetical protein
VLSDPRVLDGTHRPEPNKQTAGGWQVRDIAKGKAALARFKAANPGRLEAWKASHPLRLMLYDARVAVKKTKLRLETME